MRHCAPLLRIGCWAALLLSAAASEAGELTVTVTDANGAALPQAVVQAMPAGGAPPLSAGEHVIDQIDKTFVPMVSVIQTGTRVSFPNKDNIRHHVYSFSPAKSFDLKLYHGTPSEPVLFDKAGTVILGCNIHDQMVAYVQVVDTPYFAITDDRGIARLANLPAGEYKLEGWHYRIADASQPPSDNVTIDDGNASVTMSLSLGEAPTQPPLEE
jgi:plastocyanin